MKIKIVINLQMHKNEWITFLKKCEYRNQYYNILPKYYPLPSLEKTMLPIFTGN